MPESPDSPAAPRGSRHARSVVIVILTLFGAFAALYGAGVFLLGRVLDSEGLASWLEPRASAALRRDVTIGAVHLRAFPLGIRLAEIRVADPTGLAHELARVEEVRLTVRLLPLLRRQVEIDELRLVQPRLTLRVPADGPSNFGDLASEGDSGPPADPPPVVLDLDEVVVVEGGLTYVDARPESDSVQLALTDLEMRASVGSTAEGWRAEGSGEGRLALLGEGVPRLDDVDTGLGFDLSGDTAGVLEVAEATLGVGAARVDLAGSVEGVGQPVRTIDMSLRADDLRLSQLLAVLPDSAVRSLPGPADAGLTVDLTLRGGLGPEVRPNVEGTVRIDGGTVEGAGGALVADAVRGTLHVHDDSVAIDGVEGQLLGGPFSTSGTVTIGDGGSFALSVASDIDLARARAAFPGRPDLVLEGRARTRVLAAGTTGRIATLRIDGSSEVEAIEIGHPDAPVPVVIPSGTVRFDGQSLTVTDLPVLLGQDRVTVTGAVRDWTAAMDPERVPVFEGRIEGERLDLASLRRSARPDTALTYGRVAFASLGQRSVAGRTPGEAARELGLSRPDSVPVTAVLDVRLEQLDDRDYTLRNVEAHVEISPDLIRVSDVGFQALGGAIDGTLNLALGQEQDEQPFTMRLGVREVAARELLSLTTPLGPFVDGTLGLEVEFAGTLDRLLLPGPETLGGVGRIALTSGGFALAPLFRELARLSGFPELATPSVESWNTPFALRDGAVILAETALRTASTELVVGGTLGLGGALDLRVAMDIPADRLEPDALASSGVAQDVLRRIQDRDEPLRAVFRIGGTVTAPTITADVASTGRQVVDAVQAEVESQVQAEVEQQQEVLRERARDLFRGLLGRRDTARAPVADTSRGAGGAPADTVPPDSLPRADTTRTREVRDTVPGDTTTALRR